MPRTEQKDLVKVDALPAEAVPADGPDAVQGVERILALAVERGDIATIEKIVALHERAQDRAAEREFNRALAEFRGKCPPIPRKSVGKVATKSGAGFTFQYADLDDIQAVVDPILADLGLSYTWDSVSANGRVKVTCTVRHANGHSVACSWETGTRSPGAEMAEAQNDSKAWTTARRQSLVQALGIKTGDPDVDGGPSPTITEAQANDLEALIDEVKADRKKFLAVYGVGRLEDLPAGVYSASVRMLEAKRK